MVLCLNWFDHKHRWIFSWNLICRQKRKGMLDPRNASKSLENLKKNYLRFKTAYNFNIWYFPDNPQKSEKKNLSPGESLSENILTRIGFLHATKQPLELPTYNLRNCKFALTLQVKSVVFFVAYYRLCDEYLHIHYIPSLLHSRRALLVVTSQRWCKVFKFQDPQAYL